MKKEIIEQNVENYINENLSLSDEVTVEFEENDEVLHISGGFWNLKMSANEDYYGFNFKPVADDVYLSEDDLDDLYQIKYFYDDIIEIIKAAFEIDDGEFDDEC